MQAFAKAARPLCHNQTLLIPLGNGVDNADILCKEKFQAFFSMVAFTFLPLLPPRRNSPGWSEKMIVGPVNDHIEKHRSFEKVMKEGGILFELTPEIDLAVDKVYFHEPHGRGNNPQESVFWEVLLKREPET